jgi:hypothetical protein
VGLSYAHTWKYHKETLCSYLYLKLKCHVFVLSFFFFLLQNRGTGRWNSCQGGGLTLLEGEILGKVKLKELLLGKSQMEVTRRIYLTGCTCSEYRSCFMCDDNWIITKS